MCNKMLEIKNQGSSVKYAKNGVIPTVLKFQMMCTKYQVKFQTYTGSVRCVLCNSGAHKILTNLTKLNERVDQFETELNANATELKKFGERMNKVDIEIKKLRDNVDNMNRSVQKDQISFPDIMKKEMEEEV